MKSYYKNFVHAGANLSDADQAQAARDQQGGRDRSKTEFQQKLVAGTKAGALRHRRQGGDLAGLSDGEIAAAAHAAEEREMTGKYVIPLQNTTQQPLLTRSPTAPRARSCSTTRGRARKKAMPTTRAPPSRELAQLRAQKAKLLGYPNYAAYVLDDQMAKTPEAVEKFLGQLVGADRRQGRRRGQGRSRR